MSLISKNKNTINLEERVSNLEQQLEILMAMIPKKKGQKSKQINYTDSKYKQFKIISKTEEYTYLALLDNDDNKTAPCVKLSNESFDNICHQILKRNINECFILNNNDYTMLPKLAKIKAGNWTVCS